MPRVPDYGLHRPRTVMAWRLRARISTGKRDKRDKVTHGNVGHRWGRNACLWLDLVLWSSWCRRAASVFVVTRPADNVVALVLPAEMHQAKYFKAVLDQQWAQIDSEIAMEYAAVADCQRRGDVRGVQRRRRQIARMLCQQYELDRLRAGLDRGFFARRGTPPKPVRCFDIAIARRGSWWSVRIPELDESIYARRRADAETMARAYIAAIMATSIAGIGVRVVSEPYES